VTPVDPRVRVGAVPRLTPLDVASGTMLGTERSEFVPAAPVAGPREALADALEPALESGHCLVSFSGGRDSSAVLAVAVDTARRRGFPDPVPITLRYPDAPGAQEDRHQEAVVRHLHLADWQRIEIRDELEAVGPVAQAVLRSHGLLFPGNAYAMRPLLERARGGTLVLGMGSSEFFLFWRWAGLADVLAGRRRPRRGDLRTLAFGLLPPALRVPVARRAAPPLAMPWLRPEVEQRVVRMMLERATEVPARWDRALAVQRTHRCRTGALRSLEALALGAGAGVLTPMFATGFMAAVADAGGARGWGGRDGWLHELAGGLLPESVLGRRDGTHLQEVVFGRHTRAFAERWSGRGLDESLVDPERLRSIWLSDRQDFRTALLMQLAWLQEEGSGTPRREAAEPALTT
jgi:hypothetical protein